MAVADTLKTIATAMNGFQEKILSLPIKEIVYYFSRNRR